MLSDKLSALSRRDLLRLAKQYGWSSTLLAAGTLTGAISLPRLAEAANSTYEKRFGTSAKHTLKFGAAGFNERNLLIERAGCLQFVNDLEERTDGAIRIEFIGNNQICGQLNCVKKTQQGIVDMYTSSTQNAAGGAPYYNVLDYAYAFPSRASMFHFFYHPNSNKIFREPLRFDPSASGRTVCSAAVREGVRFSDGTPMTPQHVAEALAGARALADQAEVRARGERVIFTLKRANARFDVALTQRYCAVVLERNGRLIGTGPYMEAPDSTPQAIRLVRNPYYDRDPWRRHGSGSGMGFGSGSGPSWGSRSGPRYYDRGRGPRDWDWDGGGMGFGW